RSGGLPGLRIGNCAVGGNGNGLGLRRDRDLGLYEASAGRYHVAVGIQLKAPVTGIGDLTVGLKYLKKAVALYHKIQRIIGLLIISLREDDLVGSGARASPTCNP